MLSCREVTERVTAYLEDELSFWQRLQFRFHVVMCRICARYLEQMRLTVAALRELTFEPVSPGFQDELLRKAREGSLTPAGVRRPRSSIPSSFPR
jgi:anti-sigma factor RsiW